MAAIDVSASDDDSDGDFAKWLALDPPPDLQSVGRSRGRAHARSLGVPYDPKNPEHGGYQHITPEEWAQWDRDNAAWQALRRALYRR
jgi:hypothetical protein